ncbi:MAG: CoA-binding protein [Myxococcales bacterium]|nr:CoA-binding protein [Myxococcales bacterium]
MPTVVIVGASSDPNKFGHRAVRAYAKKGWTVIPINPHETTIAGLAVRPRLEDVTGPVDRVSFYVPPHVGLGLLPAVRALAPREFWVNPGAESDALIAEAERLGLDPINACSIVDIGERP